MRVQDGGAGSRIFLRRKSSVQLLKFIRPVCFCLVKGIRKPTPSNITGEDFLFLRRGASSIKFDLFQRVDCVHVCAELGFGSSFAQMVVGDPEVSGRRFRFVKTQPFHNDVVGQIVFLCRINRHSLRDSFL